MYINIKEKYGVLDNNVIGIEYYYDLLQEKTNIEESDNNITNYYEGPLYNYFSYILEEMVQRINVVTSEKQLVKFLVYYYSEIMKIHSFDSDIEIVTFEYLSQFLKLHHKNTNRNEYKFDYKLFELEEKFMLQKGLIAYKVSGDTTLLEEFFSTVIKNNKKSD